MRAPEYLSIRTKHPTSNWRLPSDVARYAEHALRTVADHADLKNSWSLLVFLIKIHGHPDAIKTIGYSFPICRRALSNHKTTCPDHLVKVKELDMSASKIQRAIPPLIESHLLTILPRDDGYTLHRTGGFTSRIAIEYQLSIELRGRLLACLPRKEKSSTNKRFTSSRLAKGNEVTVVDQKSPVGKPKVRRVYVNLMKSKLARKVQTPVTASSSCSPPETASGQIRTPLATYMQQLCSVQREADLKKSTFDPVEKSDAALEAALSRLGRCASGSDGEESC